MRMLYEGGVAYTFEGNRMYEYEWKHIPSGKKGLNTVCCFSFADFIRLLNYWNRKSDDWVYC